MSCYNYKSLLMNTIYFMTLLMRLERLHDKGLLPETLEEGGGVMCKFCVLRLVGLEFTSITNFISTLLRSLKIYRYTR